MVVVVGGGVWGGGVSLCGHPAMTGGKRVYEAEGSEIITVKLFL